MSNTFPWLRADVPDDVIIAGALELMWQDLTARVTAIATSASRVVSGAARVTETRLCRVSPESRLSG